MQNITEKQTTMNPNMNTVTIPLSEFTSLKDKVESLNREIGCNNQLIENLKDNQKVIRETIIRAPYDRDKTVKEIIGLSEVKEELKIEVKKSFEAELLSLEQANEKLEKELKSVKRSLKLEQEEKSSAIDTIRTEYRRDSDQLSKDYRKSSDKWREKIASLEEEIVKIKESKTDVEVEKARNKEIIDLKARISLLEEELSAFESMNFFKRLVARRKVNDAEKQVAKEKARLIEVTNNIGTTYVRENGKTRRAEKPNFWINPMEWFSYSF